MKNLEARVSFSLLALIAALAMWSPVSTDGQARRSGEARLSSDARLNPPGPVASATITRTDNGRATVRAVRLSEPLNVDESWMKLRTRHRRSAGSSRPSPRGGAGDGEDGRLGVL